MSKSSESALPFLLIILVSITLITEKSLVFGSTVSERIAKRPDPLRKFKQYGGDYDIRNKHYWASAAFTGIYGYVVAGLWLLSGMGIGIFITLRKLWGKSSEIVEHSNSSYMIVFLLIVCFTIYAMIASGVIIVSNQKSLERTKKLEETIFGAGDDACQTIGKIKLTLIQMQTFIRQYDSKTSDLLDLITHRLRKESLNIQSFIEKSRESCDRALQTLYLVNLVIVSVNLVLLVSGLVLLIVHYRPGILVLIFSCWILTTLSWIMAGVDFFFNTFIWDTCSTMKSFNENPQKNNSLEAILPCPTPTYSDRTLAQIGYSVHSFITKINSKISEAFATNEQNEDQQTILQLCDPFSTAPNYSYSPANCAKNSIPLGDLPSILPRFICYKENTSESCVKDGKFVPEAIYVITLAYSRSIQDMINIYPDLSSLMQCSYVKEAISEIVWHQCKPIGLSTRVLWSSMLCLSLVMVVLVLLWSEKAIQDKGRRFKKWSVIPLPFSTSRSQ